MERWVKKGFAVIGIEGSTAEGAGFVQRLWAEANGRFGEVAALAKTNADGSLAGVWGAMTDMTRSFRPWTEGFTCGLYLAGVECRDDAVPPPGWTRWDVPGFEYVRIPAEGPDAFSRGLTALQQAGLTLKGAVQDHTDPESGRAYMCFPVRRLEEHLQEGS